MGQERITTTKKGSITSVQAIYVPADDLTDPAPATTFAHLDAATVLSRAIAELGIYPAVDPLDSTSRIMDPNIIGDEHYKLLVVYKKSCKITNHFKILLLFWVWMSCPKKTNLPSPVLARFNVSSPNLSKSLKFSPDMLVNSSPWNKPFPVSQKSF